MKQDQLIQRLERIVEPELDQLKENMIFQADGKYHVFEQYVIAKNINGSYAVDKKLHNSRTFSSLRLALSWCIADKYKQLDLSNCLQKLDQEKSAMSADVTVREIGRAHV